VALAKVYAKSVEPEYSLAIGIYWRKALFLTHQNLAKSAGENFPDAHVLRAWMAMYKHQPGTALREAERALDLNANDVDALKAKASAFIYLGQYSEGRKLANRIIRLDPVVLAEPQYIIGLSYFASGSYDKSADYIERALENDPTTGKYALLLAAAYGKLGMENEAKQAMLKFRKSWRGPFWIAVAVYYYPFEDGEILKHLADGFKAAGVAERPPSRYLKLDRENRLSGAQIRSLLFGHRIKGSDFWSGNGWAQKRTLEGKVSHSGQSMYTRNTDARDEGESWIEENQLCDRWSEVEGAITSCVLIYRESDGAENDYYMLTDQGPQPFRVSN
jgi:tetratricopeptide (TPR) repeat protein